MSDVAAIQELVRKQKALKKEIAKVIVGQDEVVHQIILSIFSGGHALLVGVPGLAKTLMVNTISQALGLDFKRIQFTPDLMPSDILGSEILDENRQFKFIKGPIFSNIILADEINNMMSAATHRRAYQISILAFLFLPATFLTGLLGVNLAGIPGAEHPYAFAVFCTLVAAMALLLALWLKLRRWW